MSDRDDLTALTDDELNARARDLGFGIRLYRR